METKDELHSLWRRVMENEETFERAGCGSWRVEMGGWMPLDNNHFSAPMVGLRQLQHFSLMWQIELPEPSTICWLEAERK
jgi:hypothetical protein